TIVRVEDLGHTDAPQKEIPVGENRNDFFENALGAEGFDAEIDAHWFTASDARTAAFNVWEEWVERAGDDRERLLEARDQLNEAIARGSIWRKHLVAVRNAVRECDLGEQSFLVWVDSIEANVYEELCAALQGVDDATEALDGAMQSAEIVPLPQRKAVGA
ncbi:MAG: hypothetical protein AAFY46_13830, partial [Planctomycetota bacterium]